MGIFAHIFAGAVEGGARGWGQEIDDRQKKLEKQGLLDAHREDMATQHQYGMDRLKKSHELALTRQESQRKIDDERHLNTQMMKLYEQERDQREQQQSGNNDYK